MKERLQRFLFLIVLVSLGVNGHIPSANFLLEGIHQDDSSFEYALPWEEEVETEIEGNLGFIDAENCEDGGGDGDEEIVLLYSADDSIVKSPVFFEAQYLFYFPNTRLLNNLLSVNIEANAIRLLTASKPSLFLLYHNFKFDAAPYSA